MSVIKRVFLSLGASLIGSSSVLILSRSLNVFSNAQMDSLGLSVWIALVAGVLAVLYAAGLIEEVLTRPVLLQYGKIFPTIAVVSDLDWKEKGTYVWSWEKMSPDEWKFKIASSANKSRANLKVKPIKITRRRTRWFLDRYVIIVNPYGAVYPELDIKELTIWSRIRDYVFHGGMFASVADIPFFYAYDPRRKIRYDTGKKVHEYVPSTVIPEVKDNKLTLIRIQEGFRSYIPFSETPFALEVKVGIFNTEKAPDMANRLLSLKSDFRLGELRPVTINRALGTSTVDEYGVRHEIDHVRSIVEEVRLNLDMVSPICFIYFGRGKFLVSLLFLGENVQSEVACEDITNLLCNLFLKEAEERSRILQLKLKLDGRFSTFRKRLIK